MTERPLVLPPVPFLGIYSLNSPMAGAEGEILRSDSHVVNVVTGPLQISTSVAIRNLPPGNVGIGMAAQVISFPPGRYLIVQTARAFDEPLKPFASASLEVNEVAAKIAILFPGLIAERKFEGFVNRPGSFVMAGAGPLRAVLRSDDNPAIVASELRAFDAALAGRESAIRDRFRLAARWYAQGWFADNLIDRFLSWFISLEVHPTAGAVDVPKGVRDYLHKNVYPNMSPPDLKARLEIGPMTSMRGDIVHHGLAHVGDEEPQYARRLDILEAIVRTCLRLLAGLPGGNALDPFVRPAPEIKQT